jgi:signal transduction histidine kinase
LAAIIPAAIMQGRGTASGRGKAARQLKSASRKRRLAPKTKPGRRLPTASLQQQLDQRTHELTEALAQQNATADVLRIIGSSPGELGAVFQCILENSVRICDATFGNIYRWDVAEFHLLATHNTPAALVEHRRHSPYRPTPNAPMGRMVATKTIVHVAGAELERTYVEQREPGIVAAVELGGTRSHLVVPLLKDGDLIGAMTIYRHEVRAFTDKQIALVQNFAAQAVIAIENARLLNELRESLEQQTATSDVLKIISSSSGELRPVFQAMLANAVRICEAKLGVLDLYEDGKFCNVAKQNASREIVHARQGESVIPTGSHSPHTRLAATKRLVHITNLAGDIAYKERDPGAVRMVESEGARTLLLVPMLKENELIGAFGVYRQEVRPFTDKQIALVQNFAAQAVIAVENTRLLNELRARTDELARSVEELRALGEVSQAVNSTLDRQTVLSTIVTKAVQLAGIDAGTIYVYDSANAEFQPRANCGMSDELISAIKDRHIGVSDAIAEATRARVPVQAPDLRDEPASLAQEMVLRAGYRARLIVPLLSAETIVGALVVRRKVPGEFSKSTVDLLQTFGAQSVLAIQNAHLFHEIEDKSRQLEVASRHKSQFLANMSHELRTPLNAILGYTELILDNIYGEAPQRMRAVLQRVQSNGKHLLGLINDVLDLSKIEAGQLTLALNDYSIQDMAQGVYTAVEPLAASKKLAFTLDVPRNLPSARGDDRRLAQVLLNLIGNAIKFTDAGEVAVRAAAANGAYTISVCDTGPGIAVEDQGRIFEQFQQADNAQTKTKGGAGLGLAIAKRIVEMHGGRLWVESNPGRGATFSFTVPLRVEREARRV